MYRTIVPSVIVGPAKRLNVEEILYIMRDLDRQNTLNLIIRALFHWFVVGGDF